MRKPQPKRTRKECDETSGAPSRCNPEAIASRKKQRPPDFGTGMKAAGPTARLLVSETAEAVCSAAIQTLSGYGYVADFLLERIARDVRVCQIYQGTSDVRKIIIARAL